MSPLVAPGTGGHICELFTENPHWRKRITELSRLYADALNVAMERGGGTDDRRALRYKFFQACVVFLCPRPFCQTHDALRATSAA